MNHLDAFRSRSGDLLHPAGYLHRYMKQSGMTPEDIEFDYKWNPKDFLYAGTIKAINEGFVQPMSFQEAGICAQITGIPPGVWIQATVEFYASIGVRL